jgi:hypothetical protein
VWRRSSLIVCGEKASRSVAAAGGALGAGEEAERSAAAATAAQEARSGRILMRGLAGIVAERTILEG